MLIVRKSRHILMKIEFSRQNFQKKKKFQTLDLIKFRLDVSTSVPYRQTDKYRDMTKLIVTCRNFSQAPKPRSMY